MDTPYVHLSFGVPRLANGTVIPGERLIFSTNLMGSPELEGVDWTTFDPVLNLDGRLTAEGFVYDLHNQGFSAVSFLVEIYPELDAILEEDPDFFDSLLDQDIEDLAFEFYIFATATPLSSQEYIDLQTARAEEIRLAILEDEDAPQALVIAASDALNFADLYLAGLAATDQLRAEDLAPEILESPRFASYLAAVAAGLLSDGEGSSSLPEDSIASFYESLRLWLGDNPDAFGTAELPEADEFDLGAEADTRFEAFRISVSVGDLVESLEVVERAEDSPLDDLLGFTGERSPLIRLTGPSGFGDSNFVPAGYDLPYSLRFGSDASETEAINEIRIIQAIDADLDPRSFMLSDIRLGDLELALPNAASFTGEFDFTDSRGFAVQVTAGVDVEAGYATWLLRAIDPDTGITLRGTNPQTGQPQGLLVPGAEGVVGYTIQLEDDVSTGDVVEATARVIYGSDAPLDSNTRESVADAVAPVTTLTVSQSGDTYTLDWTALDDSLGSGVDEYTIYVSLAGGPFTLLQQRTSETRLVYLNESGFEANFIVRAQDNAGNVEAGPLGVLLPELLPFINLGTLPQAPDGGTQDLPIADIQEEISTNPLFLEALLGIVGAQSSSRPSGFENVFAPFTGTGFATEIPDSGAGIGPLGIAFAPDGETVIISGGEGRNSLWSFSLAGGEAVTPLAVLDVPIYDMAFDGSGRLWATTGGGPLVQIDPNSGAILARFGEGVTLGLAKDPDSERFFVATRTGVEIFDIATSSFTPFSTIQVDGLAFAPDGTLWGTAWPRGGEVIRFDDRGRAEVVLVLENEAEGLAFGVDGTQTENLLFVTQGNAGILTVVDLVSMQTATVANGGSRGDFIHIDQRGRVFVTQSDQVTLLDLVSEPLIIATNPIDGEDVNPVVTQISLTFNQDMLNDGSANAVTSLTHYQLLATGSGEDIAIESAVYDPISRTVTLTVAPLQADAYQLTALTSLTSEFGVPMSEVFTSEFVVLQDLTAILPVTLINTRTDEGAGTITFDLNVENTTPYGLIGPVRLVFGGLSADGDGPQLAGFDGLTLDGRPFLDITPIGVETWASGEVISQTVTISNPSGLAFNPLLSVLARIPANLLPEITSTPGAAASVGVVYEYTVQATDADGVSISYLLIDGPEGASIDEATGLLRWTPTGDDQSSTEFTVRAYDERGGFDTQTWTVEVDGGNRAPVIVSIGDLLVGEGNLIEAPIAANDADGDEIIFTFNDLPAGAVFDPASGSLRWQPSFDAAGVYEIGVIASDGLASSVSTFTITVFNVNQAPVLKKPVDRILSEGDSLFIGFSASDADGDALSYRAEGLPAGAELNPLTGVLSWTAGYDQNGSYEVEVFASDGMSESSESFTLEVLNVNGQVAFDALDPVAIFEGQTLQLRIALTDPDQPEDEVIVLPDGSISASNFQANLTWTIPDLPEGASFDPTTRILRWIPGFDQAGSYALTFGVADDGDGTGAPTTDTVTLQIEVSDANAAPILEGVTTQTVAPDAVFVFEIRANDPDGTIPLIEFEGLPDFATIVSNANGLARISVAPDVFDGGDYVVTVRATDAGNGNPLAAISTETSFVIDVPVANTPPRFDFAGDQVAQPGVELVFQLRVVDLDEDALSFSADNLPAGASFTATAVYGIAEFRWTPQAGDVGTETITFRVSDSGNDGAGAIESDTLVLDIVVQSQNAAPVVEAVPIQTLFEGSPYSLQIAASDPDGHELTYTALDLPRGASVDPESGALSWTPDFAQAGSYSITVVASDGSLSASREIVLDVENVNRAPTFATLPALTAQEGIETVFAIVASDLDGDTLSIRVDGSLPNGASFDVSTGTVVWTPGFDQAGDYVFRFEASDPDGASVATEVSVSVGNVNRNPVLPDLSGRVVVIGETFELALQASDPDSGQILSYSLEDAPDGATFDEATGVFVWTPLAIQAGEYSLRFSATDGEANDSQSLRLVVSEELIPPSVFIDLVPSFPVSLGQFLQIQVIGSGVADIASIQLLIDGEAATLDDQGRVAFTPDRAGQYELVATVTDIDGETGTAIERLRVLDATDADAPVVLISGLSDNASITEVTSISAVIEDVNLDFYRLELIPLAGGESILLAEGFESSSDLAVDFDPSLLANGAYRLQLTAFDIGGRSSVESRLIEINALERAGSLQISNTDLSVILGGETLELVRFYDSAAAATSRVFGFGGKLLAYDLNASLILDETGNESLGLFAPVQIGTRIFVDLPDGSRAGFTFDPVEVSDAGSSKIYRAAWRADAGIDYQLDSSPALLQLAGGSFYELETGLAYNPNNDALEGPAYTLTGSEGDLYFYGADGLLSETESSSGEVLLWSASGVVASNGDRLSFQWDAQGRLIALIGASGVEVSYRYDSEGNLASVSRVSDGWYQKFGYENPSNHRLSAVGSSELSESLVARYDSLGRLESVDSAVGNLGALRDFNGLVFDGVLGAGETDWLVFEITESELLRAPSGSVLLGIELEGSGFDSELLASLNGALVELVSSGNRTVAIVSISEAGAHAISVKGSTESDAGAYQLEVYLVGDSNGDNKVDGLDDASADANRDGTSDDLDRFLNNRNFGFIANRAPTAVAGDALTHVDLPLQIDLSDLGMDADGDPLRFHVLDTTNGSVRLSEDGSSVWFTPGSGYVGDASFTFVADDGDARSSTATYTVQVSDAALVSLSLEEQVIRLDSGESVRLVVTGDFEDQTNVLLPASYLSFESSNPDAGVVTDQGWLLAVANGFGAFIVSVGGLRTVGAFRVGPTESQADIDLEEGGLVTQSPAVAVAINGGTFEVTVFHADGSLLSDVSYWLGNDALGSVSASGVVTGQEEGSTSLLVVYRGQALEIPVEVVRPTAAPVEVDDNGGVVEAGDGSLLTIAPGALEDPFDVTIDLVTEGELPYVLLDGQKFFTAFDIDFGDQVLNQPAQLAIPAGALPVGRDVALYHASTIVGPGGDEIRVWLQTEFGVVGSDGFIRTGEGPVSAGIRDSGVYLVSEIDPTTNGTLEVEFNIDGRISTNTESLLRVLDTTGGSTTPTP
ncbi:MAG: putative Ig domain-containing protein [Verrucomicrobiota bacterium]